MHKISYEKKREEVYLCAHGLFYCFYYAVIQTVAVIPFLTEIETEIVAVIMTEVGTEIVAVIMTEVETETVVVIVTEVETETVVVIMTEDVVEIEIVTIPDLNHDLIQDLFRTEILVDVKRKIIKRVRRTNYSVIPEAQATKLALFTE